MTHAFVVRLPLIGAPSFTSADPDRLNRLSQQGWAVSRPLERVDAALCGSAATSSTNAWTGFGLAFLEDRASVEARLNLSKAQAHDTSDLDLLVGLRALIGPDFAAQAHGSFSVVFVNHETGAVEAYRDHFGVYPMFYAHHDGALTMSSDLRACLHLAGVPLAVDPWRVADFLHGEDIDVDRTAFEGICRLPPAHRLIPVNGPLTPERYWQVDLTHSGPVTDAPARLRQALAQATAARVSADASVGAMLSGGLDSSSLAGMAAQAAPRKIRTLSFVYGRDKAYDESPFIDMANEAFGADPHKIPVAAAPSLDTLGPVIDEQMDLFLAPGLPKSRQIYAEAQSLGLDALIDGHGGDEVISHGYGRLVELATARRFLRLFRESRGAARIHGIPLSALYTSHIARYAGLKPRNPVRRALMKIARVQARGASLSGNASGVSPLISSDLATAMDAPARYAPQSPLRTKQDFQQAEKLTHFKSLTDPLLAQSFEVLHRSATAQGVLPRYPFFDQRVVTLCLALPADTKLRDGLSRWVLRAAMEGILPEKIRLRTDKAEFGTELADAVKAFFRTRDETAFASLTAFVNTSEAEKLRARVIAEGGGDVAAIRALWRLAVLIQWVDRFEDWREAQARGQLI